jgi:hypothetical protein
VLRIEIKALLEQAGVSASKFLGLDRLKMLDFTIV